MDGFLRGESANLCGPLDLMEKQESYHRSVKGFKAQEGQNRGSESRGPSDLHVNSHIRVSCVETSEYCKGNREITICDIPKARG
jgi:hypothetical protein